MHAKMSADFLLFYHSSSEIVKEAIQKSVEPHLTVSNVNGDEHSGIEVDIADLSNGG